MARLVIQGSFLVLLSLQQISAQCTDYAYKRYAQQHVSGGVLTSAGNGVVANCQTQCNAPNSACIGYDYSTSNQCYLITNFRTSITSDTSASHYRFQAGCISTARNEHCFYSYAGTFTFTAATTTAANNLASCGQACVDNAACTAYTFQANNNECKLLTQAASTAAFGANTAVKAYVRLECSSCPAYDVFPNQAVTNGPPQVARTTLETCRAGCTATPDCEGFNFEAASATKCYFITDANAASSRTDKTGTNNYVRLCLAAAVTTTTPGTGSTTTASTITTSATSSASTASTATTTAGCVPTWTWNNNTAAQGGTFKSQFSTIETCLAACAADSNCIAIDADTNPGSPYCWFHLNNIGTTSTKANVYHIVLKERCPTVCEPTYTLKNNTSSSGGSAVASATTVDACKAECKANANCVAFDADFTGGTFCWLHLAAANIQVERPTTNAYQYIINRDCGTTTGSPTTTTGVTTISGCKADWTLKNNTSSSGGTSQPALTTAETCQASCVADTTCKGVDIDFRAGNVLCWFHTDVSLPNTRTTINVFQYVLNDRCVTSAPACVAKWTTINSRSSGGGVQKTEFTSTEACQAGCQADTNCVAIDVVGGTQCWFHLDKNDLTDERSSAGVVQFVLDDRCVTAAGTTTAPGCTAKWTTINSRSSGGGVQKTEFTSTETCQAGCIADTNCVAIDVVAGNACWFHLNKDNLNDERTSTGVVQLVLDDRCVTDPGTTTAPGCTAKWTTINSRSSGGGVQKTEFTSTEACQAGCIADTTCVAIDVVAGNVCWFHLNKDNLNDERTSTGVVQLVLDDRCVTAGTTGAGCEASWSMKNNTSSNGGTREASYTTFAACAAACIKDNVCVAIDVDFNGGNLCWFHRDINNIAVTRQTNGIFQYVLQDRCVTGTTTPACEAVWTMKNNTNSQGAVERTQFTTAETCQAGCIADTACVAVDVNFGTGTLCWFHLSVNNLVTSATANGVYQYKLETRCATASTPAYCRPVWTKFNNTKSHGAQPLVTYRIEVECLGSCVESDVCVGVDIDMTPGNILCWHHTSLSQLTGNQQAASGVDQYVLDDRCSTSSASTAATPTASTVSPGCLPAEWKITNNTHAFGGSARTDLTTATTCLTACVSDTNCVGVDLDFASNAEALCWFHTNTADFSNTGAQTNAYLYELVDRCPTSTVTPSGKPCNPLWEIFNNTHAFGGVTFPGPTSAQQCLDACVADSSCVGVDIDFNANTLSLCWFHTNTANFADTGSQTNVYLYVLKDRCPAACTPAWEVTNNTHAFNGLARTDYTTAETCLAACVADPTCQGVDLDFAAVTFCWFHTNTADFSDTEAQTGSYLYRLVDRCPSGSTVTPTTRPTTRPSTTPSTSPSTASPACRPQWSIANNTHAFNGIERTDLLTPQACLDACVAEPRCVAVDLDFRAGETLCWLHNNARDLSDTGALTNSYLYILVDRCPTASTSTTPSECDPLWESFPGRNAPNGVEAPTVLTANLCWRACLDNPSCLAVDINQSPGQTLCWLHLQASDITGTLGSLPGNTLWILRDRCPDKGTTTPPGQLVCGMHEYRSTQVNGGQNMGQFPSPDACSSQCFFTPSCLAADFDKSKGDCYFHTRLNSRNRDNCCIRFERICQLGGCFDKFENYPNRIGVGGILRSNILTSSDCGSLCLREPRCERFDFRRPNIGAQCLTSIVPYGDSLGFNNQFDANERVRCSIPNQITTQQPPTQDCVGDLVFILDESSTVNQGISPGQVTNFERVKQFVKGIVQSLTIASNKVRVAVVTYENSVKVHFDLDDRMDLNSVLLGIDAIPYDGGDSNTPAALLTAANVVLNPSVGGARQNVPNTVVLITDGITSSNVASQLPAAANLLKSVSSNIFVVGVSNRVNLAELQLIATTTNRVSVVSDFTRLASALSAATLGVCQAVTPAPVTPAPVTPAPVTPAPVTPAPVTPAPVTPDLIRCELDLILVIDSSGSINDDSPGNFNKVRQFLRQLVQTLSGAGHLTSNVRIALVSFGSQTFLRLNLNNGFTTPQQFGPFIDNLPYDGGRTNTTGALKTVLQNILVTNLGDRPTVNDVILLVTDGKPNLEVQDLPSTVQTLRARGVRTIGVGVTNRVNETIMAEIVSSPLSLNFFNVDDFALLEGRLNEILQGACLEITTTLPPVQRCNLDMAFVIDSSGSIQDKGAGNFALVKGFMKNVVDFVDLDEVQLAGLSYSNQAFEQFNFNAAQTLATKANIKAAIDVYKYDGGSTNTSGALRYADRFFFNQQYGDRPNVQDLIILVTDGVSTVDQNRLNEAVNNLKNRNVQIIAVGVTNDIDVNELNTIATNRPDGTKAVFTVNDFDNLAGALEDILRSTCSFQPRG